MQSRLLWYAAKHFVLPYILIEQRYAETTTAHDLFLLYDSIRITKCTRGSAADRLIFYLRG